uniref:Ig-like domain-containing protein n=1 Tax=Sander lucioperca TaxID=283035 RepID=A0A8D0D6E7_SANLU
MPSTHLKAQAESFLFIHSHWLPFSAALERSLTACRWAFPHTPISLSSLEVEVATNPLQPTSTGRTFAFQPCCCASAASSAFTPHPQQNQDKYRDSLKETKIIIKIVNGLYSLILIKLFMLLSPPDGPKLPSVSVSPSAEIVEGSSVTLTCSSDANPAAKYTWYKENVYFRPPREEPQLVFSSIQSSDSGQYYCTAENELGRKKSNDFSVNVKSVMLTQQLTTPGTRRTKHCLMDNKASTISPPSALRTEGTTIASLRISTDTSTLHLYL